MKKTRRNTIMLIIIVIVILNLAACIVIPIVMFNSMLGRHVEFAKTWTAGEFGLEADNFFVKTDDGFNIDVWEVAAESPKAIVVCLSGMHGPSATIYFGHAQSFKEHGIATIILDMRGHGKSDGGKISAGYTEWRDVKAVVDYVKQKPLYDSVPIVVFGVSLGAATAINAAGEIADIDGVIALSAFSSWEEVFCDNMAVQVPRILSEIERPFVPLASYLFFGPDSRRIKPRMEIKKLGNRPLLLMHSTGDTQVPYRNFETLTTLAPAHVETFVRDGDLHFITEHFDNPKEDAEYLDTIMEFINNMPL
ncbi:MAG: lysophospholipase [Culturomica sp.]|jgi:alpha-beta hydrolase superfamily lysophospholipase|nr:lysophospholipase [Culturomica sp.]